MGVKDENELADRARVDIQKAPDARATISADKSVTYGRIIAVMDALRRVGVTRVVFAVPVP